MLVTGSGDALDTWGVRRVWFNFRGFDSVESLLAAWAPRDSPLRSFAWKTARECVTWGVGGWVCGDVFAGGGGREGRGEEGVWRHRGCSLEGESSCS